MNCNEFKVFAGSTSIDFTNKVCDYLGIERGKSETISFSDGNIFVKVNETVRGKDVYFIQSIAMKPNDEFTEILFWIDAFKRASANSVTVIIPYFGYAKGDKKDEPRVSIRGRVCAECIEAIGADRVVTMDLHSPQVQGFFRKPVDNLFAFPIICNYIQQTRLDNYVIVSPDVGFSKQATKFAELLDAKVAIGNKVRKGHDENPEIMDIIGDVSGKNAVIVDDFTISGGTLINLTKALKFHGAKKIIACLSHNLISKTGIEKLNDSDIEYLISTDTIYNENIAGNPKVRTLSAAPLFAESILRISNRESLSPIFDDIPQKIYDYSIR